MRYTRYYVLGLLLILALALVSPASAAGSAPQAPRPPQAPLLNANSARSIPGSYIVVLKSGGSADAVDQAIAAARHAADRATAPMAVRFRYDAALHGFAGTLPAPAVEALRNLPFVDYIEADQTMTIDTTQSPATWGLDRIDQRSLPLNKSYTYNYTGAGVTAYIIDTGIRTSHNDFGGRASVAYDAVGDGRNGQDCNGHGTHVAGTVGGSTYGVAKGVTLKAVRVLNCSGSGSTSGVIAGVNWVTKNHAANSVANMSLGGSASSSLDSAIQSSINAGVVYAIAAGNSSANACNYSPARVAAAITVGATTSSDARASYSNYGTCLDIFAPGSSITSDWYSSNTATNTISGTSMATPHVTGVAALVRQHYPSYSPASVRNAIVNAATTGKVTGAGSGSPNALLYSLVP